MHVSLCERSRYLFSAADCQADEEETAILADRAADDSAARKPRGTSQQQSFWNDRSGPPPTPGQEMACLSPRESAAFIAENSQDVKIDHDAVPHLAKLISTSKGEYNDTSSWHGHPLHPSQANEAAIDWIFLVDSLNFSFWTPDEAKYKVTFQGQTYTGYWALCAAINRALQEGVPVTSAAYLSSVTLEEVKKVFRPDDPSTSSIPLLQERQQVMNDVGKTLAQEFGGSFVHCLGQCGGSAAKLVDVVTRSFPSFRDTATFRGKTVSFYKRAQILAGDIWACFGGKGLGAFQDINCLTMFADYRVPQVLLHYGVLKYSDCLMEKLRKEELLDNGCREEVEIRGSSIWAVELICRELLRLGHQDLNAVQVDFYLWDYRRLHADELESVPYHRTRSIYY